MASRWRGTRNRRGTTGLRRGHVYLRRLSIVGGAQLHQRGDWNTTYWFNNPIPDDPFAAGVPSVQDATIRDRSRGGFAGVTYKGLNAMTSFTEWRTAAFVRGTVGENRWQRGFADIGYGFQASRAWKMNLNATYTRNLFAHRGVPVHQARLERDAVRVDQLREPDVTRPGDVRRAAQPGERQPRRTTALASRYRSPTVIDRARPVTRRSITASLTR